VGGGLFTVGLMGRSGGLALFWLNSKEVEIVYFSLRHINANITMSGMNWSWKLTCFYGHPNRLYQEESWNLLSHLSSFSSREWLCLGDFNDISNLTEKRVGAIRNEAQMAAFRTTLEGCRLRDLGL
jgi:hypothetical protein